MAAVDPKTKTTYATTDWSKYQQGRPPYPPSLTELILNYHSKKPTAGYERLIDIGAGSGVASTNFMPSFQKIHISDPSPSNLEQARSFLSSFATENGLSEKVELEFSQAVGEEVHLSAGEGQADLVICATAAHFIDPDGLVGSAAKALRRGGTLAVFSYWMPSFPGKSEGFYERFVRVFDEVVLRALLGKVENKPPPDWKSGENGEGEGEKWDLSKTHLGKVVSRRMTGEGGLDSLPLPEELFEDGERVYINLDKGEEIPFSGLYKIFAPPGRDRAGGPSRVGERDRIVRYFTEKGDRLAEGWEFEVDKEWLAKFFDTIQPPGVVTSRGAEEALAEWDRVFAEECPEGRTRIRWPAFVVLGTKK